MEERKKKLVIKAQREEKKRKQEKEGKNKKIEIQIWVRSGKVIPIPMFNIGNRFSIPPRSYVIGIKITNEKFHEIALSRDT